MTATVKTEQVIPAEWATQDAILVGFPSHQALWEGALLSEARQEVAALCNNLSEVQTCHVMVANHDSEQSARKLLSSRCHIHRFDFGDIWFRDIAPIFFNPAQALRFNHNGWGKKYLYPFDDRVAARCEDYFKVNTQHFDFVLEGGALDHNGRGDILTTKQCLLNANRNHWSQPQAEDILRQAFNANNIYWLNNGLSFDHTDGHVDNAARFINPQTILCQQATGNDDPNAGLYNSHMIELQDQGLLTNTIPSPGLIKDANGNIMPASHLNFVLANELVIFPHYLKYTFANKMSVDETKEKLSDMFQGREVLSLPSNALLTGGGSFHCITQNIPK